MTKDKQILDLMVDIETLSTNRDKGVVLSVVHKELALEQEKSEPPKGDSPIVD